jgi:hypothetical protein
MTERRDCALRPNGGPDVPRYYFHILNGKMLIDDVGVEVADTEAAKLEAVKYAGTVLTSEHPTDMWRGIPWEM